MNEEASAGEEDRQSLPAIFRKEKASLILLKILRASLYGLPNNGKGQALALLGLFKNHFIQGKPIMNNDTVYLPEGGICLQGDSLCRDLSIS